MILTITHHDMSETVVHFRNEGAGPSYLKESAHLGLIVRYQDDAGEVIKGTRWIIPSTSIKYYHIDVSA